MKKFNYIFYIFLFVSYSFSQNAFQVDTINTSAGKLLITFIGHGTLMFQINDEVIHIDPFSRVADYSTLPKADIILITHNHGDHLDPAAINIIMKSNTKVYCNESSLDKIDFGIVMKNGDTKTIANFKTEAVPAYNIEHKRDNGEPFHSKGDGNGYILTIGNKKIYIAGDTENIPEMKNLKNIDVAFLPMNLPYTMTPAMVADAASMFNPKILYPYHTGETNTDDLLQFFKTNTTTEVRIRNMK